MKSDTFSVLSAETLFSKLKIDANLPKLRQLAGLHDTYFDRLYRSALYSFADAVQLVPASEAHHHARPGGLLEHTVDMAHISLRLRQGHKLPVGATAEIVAKESAQWTYAVFIGALLHDIGKLISDFRILAQLSNGEERVWTPLHGSLQNLGATQYRVEFLDLDYRYHSRLCASCLAILPPVARGWLAEHPELFYQLTSYLSGEVYDGSIFGQIVTEADRVSVAADLKLPNERFTSRRKRPLGDYILDAIRALIRERTTIVRNRPGAMAWIKDGYTYMVCRPFVSLLHRYFDENNIGGLPREFTRVYSLLLEHGIAEANPKDAAASIWFIRVSAVAEESSPKDANFDHEFTVLVFKTQRIFLPTRMPENYKGDIQILDQILPATSSLPSSNIEPSDSSDHDENNIDNQVNSRAVENRKNRDKHGDAGDQVNVEENDSNKEIHREITSVQLTWDDDLPEALLEWIRVGIEDRELPYNKPNSVIHVVEFEEEPHIALVTPAAFQTFCKNVGLDDFNKVQKRFFRRKWNLKSNQNLNVHALWTKGDNKSTKLNCILLHPSKVLRGKTPIVNKYIVEKRPG